MKNKISNIIISVLFCASLFGFGIPSILEADKSFDINREISVKENKLQKAPFKAVRETRVVIPKWLEFSTEKLAGKIVALPGREDIDLNIEEHLIVELYSK